MNVSLLSRKYLKLLQTNNGTTPAKRYQLLKQPKTKKKHGINTVVNTTGGLVLRYIYINSTISHKKNGRVTSCDKGHNRRATDVIRPSAAYTQILLLRNFLFNCWRKKKRRQSPGLQAKPHCKPASVLKTLRKTRVFDKRARVSCTASNQKAISY